MSVWIVELEVYDGVRWINEKYKITADDEESAKKITTDKFWEEHNIAAAIEDVTTCYEY